MVSKRSAERFGIGLLVGLAIGAAIGILYAPQSAREARMRRKYYHFLKRYRNVDRL